MGFGNEVFCAAEGFGESVLVVLRVAVDGTVVDECGGSWFTLAGVYVSVGEFVFFEPLDHVYSELGRRYPRTLEHVLGTA